MIGSIKGVILLKQAPQVLVDCNGVGYEIETPMTTFIELPEIPEVIAPLIYSIPLQLLAYHVAILKGTVIDQPRNLAKSVTVE